MSHHTHFYLQDRVPQHNVEMRSAEKKVLAEAANQGYTMESNTAENAAIKNFLPKCAQVIGALSESSRKMANRIEAYTHVLRDLHNNTSFNLKNSVI